MRLENQRKIFSSRIMRAALDEVYRAFSDPSLLKQWWGPYGFTNTIHEFDLRPGGRWRLTMHGPEKGHYGNEAEFTRVEPFSSIAWKRISQPYFNMEIGFRKIAHQQTEISFTMEFPNADECAKMRKYVQPKNEENFDRLEELLVKESNSSRD